MGDRTSIERPDWIKVRAVPTRILHDMREKLDGGNTVCLGAKCPNLGECFSRGVAAFMIGGAVCTRACRFCGVGHGKPEPLDPDEPARVASSVAKLGLKYVVITGVARDDLPDGGAGHYAATVRAVRQDNPDICIEILIPDFSGDESSLRAVIDSSPTVINHNIETVRRLTTKVRSRATYERSLNVLKMSKSLAPDIPVKSGLMVGLGETFDEVIESMQDIRVVGCTLITIGQYLQPRAGKQLSVERYWTLSEFEELKRIALEMGFRAAACGPFVRSSYFAEEMLG